MNRPVLEALSYLDIAMYYEMYMSSINELDHIPRDKLYYNIDTELYYRTDTEVPEAFAFGQKLMKFDMKGDYRIIQSFSTFNFKELFDVYDRISNYHLVTIRDNIDVIISFYVNMDDYKDVPEDELNKRIIMDNIDCILKGRKIEITHILDA